MYKKVVIIRVFKRFHVIICLLLLLTGCGEFKEREETPSEAPEALYDMPETAPAPIRSKYTVNMEFFPETNEVTGVLKVNYLNTSHSDRTAIYMNTYLNAFDAENKDNPPFFDEFEDKVYRYGEDYGYFKILNVAVNNEEVPFENSGTILLIKLDEPLRPGVSLDIILRFEAKIPMICHRTGGNGKAFWFGNFIPSVAVHDLNGWNVEKYSRAGQPFYAETANYTVNIVTPKEYTVVGSGQAYSKEADDKKVTSFNESMIRDFAFAIGKGYEKETVNTDSGVEINFYHYSDVSDVDLDKVFDTVRKTLNHFDERIATYPYGTLNVVETEMFLEGGMDYPQIIFIDSDYLRKEGSMKTLSFLVGHQWFYNIIGTNQIKSAWIDKGMTIFLIRDIFQDRDKALDMTIKNYNDVMALSMPNKKLDTPIGFYESWADYYNIQYKKAELMMFSLEAKMGQEKFNAFLKQYYAEYSFKVAAKENFIKMAEEVYEDSLEEFFYGWLMEDDLPPLISR